MLPTSFPPNVLVRDLTAAEDDLLVQHVLSQQASPPHPSAERNVRAFLTENRAKLGLKSFGAFVDDCCVASVTCQVWEGPLPLIVEDNVLKMGAIWGLFGRDQEDQISKSRVLQAAVAHCSQSLGCNKCVVMGVKDQDRELFEDAGFVTGNALVKQLDNKDEEEEEAWVDGIEISIAGAEADQVVVQHWREMWIENGVPQSSLVAEASIMTLNFLKTAREESSYVTVTATLVGTGEVVGSVSCQRHKGTAPVVGGEASTTGTVWAVFVKPSCRRRGIGHAMMRRATRYFKDLGCDQIALLYASDEGCRVYKDVGYCGSHMLVLPLPAVTKQAAMVDQLSTALATIERPELFVSALPLQLRAVCQTLQHKNWEVAVRTVQQQHDTFVDEDDNWFTQNAHRLGGNFDMKQLALDTNNMATKFTRLSKRWEHFVTGCRYEQVFAFLADAATKPLFTDTSLTVSSPLSTNLTVVDLCCGIGLPGHTLRLMGFAGTLIGTDISPGMLAKAHKRQCFDSLFAADANQPIPIDDASADIVVCTGALELLDIPAVLAHCRRALKPKGELWASFQWDNGKECPTKHQNVSGLTREKVEQELSQAGFAAKEMVECPSAFVTPCPGGDLQHVPYLFCRALAC